MQLRPAGLFSTLVLCLPALGQDLVAHRGASHDAPENTLAAFRLAWEQGADAIEGDFRLTSDGHIVCLHDANTERTAGASLVAAETTLAELRELEVGSWKAARFAGEKIPTLDEVLGVVPPGKVVLIEIKCGVEIVPALEQALSRSELEPAQVRLIAFDAEVIAACKQRLPELEAYWLTGHKRDEETGRWSNPIEEVLPTLARIGADGLDTSVPAEVVDAGFVRRLRAAGHQFHAYTVNDAGTAARLYWLGVDSITTDRPAALRAMLPQRALRDHLRLHLALDGSVAPAELLPARTGKVAPTWASGVYGQALDLSGEAGALRVAQSLPERGTLALWCRPRGWYDYQTLFDTPAHENGWEMWIYGNAQLRFRAHPSGATLSHAFHPTGDADEWHHVAVVWDRGDDGPGAIQLFVNGHEAARSPWSERGWFRAGESFFLGGGHPGNTRARGTFDEVVLLDVPLEADEVRFLMRAAVVDG